MIWIILFVLGIVIFAVGCFCFSPKVGDDSLRYIGVGVAVTSVILGLMFTFGNGFDYTFSDEAILRETTEIYALADKYSLKGNFYLAHGSISSAEYYYYIKDTDKGKTTDKIPQKETYITEDNSQKPRIEEYSYKGTRDHTKDFWISLSMGNNKADELYKPAYYKVYIPENSINYDFNIDFE